MSKFVLVSVAAAFCMAAASPALAATPDSSAPKAEQPEPGASPTATDKTKYCVVDTLTGSRISKKTCHTRKEWLAQGFDPLAR